ncbi:vWA domain-containing protein [Candidatus Methanodesulfokora washburnensis]|jgi:Mg-chelatase subunit ChlD|uniref:VWA domain-containing protein n=1 Tax=Candidatus Methanodesulfokora washburnensis TaxID=2478471 RepID=A0A3R9QCW8_9CREN|nr:VWA domain-containing protein [Candidatus Methanodesulfokores washburnensis]RSN73474.1 VWA domain-containing protein [Candidatus Methanodesulfokores washburnensis]
MSSVATLEVKLNRGELPTEKDSIVFARVTIKPTKEVEELVRAHPRKVHLAIVVDASSSMCGEKLDTAKAAALRRYERDLGDEDYLSFITFESSAYVIVDTASKKSRGDIGDLIESIQCGFLTNLYEGIEKGIRLLQKTPQGYLRRMVIMTDGMPTTGITDPEKIIDLVRRARDMNIEVSVYGIGDDYDMALCKAISEAGGGYIRHASKPDQLEGLSKTTVDKAKSTILDKVELKVDLADKVEVQGAVQMAPRVVLITLSPEQKHYSWDLGSLSTAENAIVAMKLNVKAGFPEGRQKIGEVSVGMLKHDIYVNFAREVPFVEDPDARLYYTLGDLMGRIIDKATKQMDASEEYRVLNALVNTQEVKNLQMKDVVFAVILSRILESEKQTRVEQGITRPDYGTRVDSLINVLGG